MVKSATGTNSHAMAAKDAGGPGNLGGETVLVQRKEARGTNLHTRLVPQTRIMIDKNPAHTHSLFKNDALSQRRAEESACPFDPSVNRGRTALCAHRLSAGRAISNCMYLVP